MKVLEKFTKNIILPVAYEDDFIPEMLEEFKEGNVFTMSIIEWRGDRILSNYIDAYKVRLDSDKSIESIRHDDNVTIYIYVTNKARRDFLRRYKNSPFLRSK